MSTVDLDLDAVKTWQPQHQHDKMQDASPRPSGTRIVCLTCENTYPTPEAYWQRDHCDDHGEGYGCGPQ